VSCGFGMVSHPPEVAGLKNGNLGGGENRENKKKKKNSAFFKKNRFFSKPSKMSLLGKSGFLVTGTVFSKKTVRF